MTTEVIVKVPADAKYKARVVFHDWDAESEVWTEDKMAEYQLAAGGEQSFYIYGTRGISVDEVDHE